MDAFLAEKQPTEEEEAAEKEAEEEAAASSSSSEDEEPAPKKAKGKGGAATTKKKGTGGGGFQKPLKLSPAMQQFTGEERLSRAQIVKKCWVSFCCFCFCLSLSSLPFLPSSLSPLSRCLFLASLSCSLSSTMFETLKKR